MKTIKLVIINLFLAGICQNANAMGMPFKNTLRNFGTKTFERYEAFKKQEADTATRRLKYALLGSTFAAQYSLAKSTYTAEVAGTNQFARFIAPHAAEPKKLSILEDNCIISGADVFKVIEEEVVDYVQNNSTLQKLLQHKHAQKLPLALAGTSFVVNIFLMQNVLKTAMTKASLVGKFCGKALGIDYPRFK